MSDAGTPTELTVMERGQLERVEAERDAALEKYEQEHMRRCELRVDYAELEKQRDALQAQVDAMREVVTLTSEQAEAVKAWQSFMRDFWDGKLSDSEFTARHPDEASNLAEAFEHVSLATAPIVAEGDAS